VPLPSFQLAEREHLSRSLSYFPLIGFAIGALLVGLDRLLAPLLARPLLDFVLLATLILASGGLHFDGLIDTADGMFGPGPPERRLAAMRQSAAGPRGVKAGLLLLLAQFAALASLPTAHRVEALLLAPTLGRWAIVYGYVAFPYARGNAGLSVPLKQGATLRAAIAATGFALLAVALVSWPNGLLLVLVAWPIAATAGRLALHQLGGMSGDVYGATEQIVETAVLLAAPPLRQVIVCAYPLRPQRPGRAGAGRAAARPAAALRLRHRPYRHLRAARDLRGRRVA